MPCPYPPLAQNIDFTRLCPLHRLPLVHQLAQISYGRCVRALNLKVALGTATSVPSQQDTVTAQQALLDHNQALSVRQTVSLLDSLPHLTSLKLEFINALPGTYVSRLPTALETALRRHGPQLQHFGITSAQLKPLDAASTPTTDGDDMPSQSISACAYFQLDEQLVADVLSLLPRLRSLSSQEVGYDSLAPTSPLFEAISSLARLQKLDILDGAIISAKWTSRALSGPLESLCLVSKSGSIPSSFDTFIDSNKTTLKSLSLVCSSPHQSQTTTSSPLNGQRYYLPALQNLSIEASEDSDIDSISYLERYTTCPLLERIAINSAKGISTQDLEAVVLAKTLKNLKILEIRQDSLTHSNDQDLGSMKDLAEVAGVQLCISD